MEKLVAKIYTTLPVALTWDLCLSLSPRPASFPVSFFDALSTDSKQNIHSCGSVNEGTTERANKHVLSHVALGTLQNADSPWTLVSSSQNGDSLLKVIWGKLYHTSNHKALVGRPVIITANDMIFVILMDLISGDSSLGKGQQSKKESKHLSIILKIYLERQITWAHRIEIYFQG